MEQWSQLEVLEPGGEFHAFLWHPRPAAFVNSHDVDGWLTVILPADLGPAPGAAMELRARSLLSPQIQNARIYQALVKWLDPAQGLTK